MGEGAGGPRSGRGRGGGRGERSSRVTSPTRRRGHRRRRRHFNRAFGLRSALSARAKDLTRSASRSHSSASRPLFASRPPTSPSAHTPHAPHPAAAGSPPSLSSSVRPPRPRSTPSTRSPTPPSPDLCQRPEGKHEASAAAGGVRVILGSCRAIVPSSSLLRYKTWVSADLTGSCSRHCPSNIRSRPPLFFLAKSKFVFFQVAAERPSSQEGKPQEIFMIALKPIMAGRPRGFAVKWAPSAAGWPGFGAWARALRPRPMFLHIGAMPYSNEFGNMEVEDLEIDALKAFHVCGPLESVHITQYVYPSLKTTALKYLHCCLIEA
ncbi:uncharacterized protein LOC131412285 [Diceros bicornis minor]|uniref:uncharacterized protein LOC131412285 n=1 Tax=Diceros bicornis minor TaxID=77932 RepID=UPI0026EBC4AB|nr:uncharacterized protein LOC131412285 [Diceros bicornis minor]